MKDYFKIEAGLSWAVLQLLFNLKVFIPTGSGLSWAVLRLLFSLKGYFKIEAGLSWASIARSSVWESLVQQKLGLEQINIPKFREVNSLLIKDTRKKEREMQKFHIDQAVPPKNPPVISLTQKELEIFRQRRWNRYYRTWRNEETITHYVEEEFLVWKKLAKEFQKLQIDPRNPVFKGKHPLLSLWKTIDRQWGDLFVDLSTDPLLSKTSFYKLY